MCLLYLFDFKQRRNCWTCGAVFFHLRLHTEILRFCEANKLEVFHFNNVMMFMLILNFFRRIIFFVAEIILVFTFWFCAFEMVWDACEFWIGFQILLFDILFLFVWCGMLRTSLCDCFSQSVTSVTLTIEFTHDV